MARRSAVLTLPPEVKEWLDQALIKEGFGNYQLLADALKERGYEISKSAVHRYGQQFEEKLAALKVATEQAKAIVTSAPDDENAMTEALMRLVQEKLFVILNNLGDVDPAKVNVSSLAKSIAELARASVAQKKWAEEVRQQERDRAAELVDEMATAQGLGEEQARFWREKVLGVR